MTDPNSSWDPPQDTGAPDPVESDGAALTGAEDLDEDRLHTDPLEAGMDPPEQWTGATKYGMTPWEQAHDRGLEERLAEEEPEVAPTEPATPGPAEAAAVWTGEQEDRQPDVYERDLGISADGTTATRNP
ncbi:hypothetical protein ACQP2U_08090 [Nocardia sp. CA-084685]|uniref:hypothetical protein n=1 Tax=Nocardia sp. CA-084685 TaxID=3239970 RepID=UPI003D99BE12